MLREGMRIEFAHRTFRWSNDAPGQAAVHCVIIGFGLAARVDKLKTRRLFDYPEVEGAPVEGKAKNINPYLVDAPNVVLANRREPICDAPPIVFGSMPLSMPLTDGGAATPMPSA